MGERKPHGHPARSRWRARITGAFVIAAGAGVMAPAQADDALKPTMAITLPAGQKVTSFDIGYVDPVIGLYVLADRGNNAIAVIDTATNTVLNQLAKGAFKGATGSNDTSGPDGVLIVDHREVWAGDGNSTIKVIDLFTQQVTRTIFTGGVNRADQLCHDPRDHVVLMANDADSPPFVTFIPTRGPNAYQVVRSIKMDGSNGAPKASHGIEQCQWSHRTGKFYLNLPEVGGIGRDTSPGAVVVLDPKSMTIEKIFSVPLASCAGPRGMAVGPDHQILLGCGAPGPGGNHPSVIIDERDGHVIATLANESGADAVAFNPGDDRYVLARPAAVGPSQLLGVVDADTLRPEASVPTALAGAPTAHSVAVDPIMNQIYVPIPAGHSRVCSAAGGNDVLGCIAVFTRGDGAEPASRDAEPRSGD